MEQVKNIKCEEGKCISSYHVKILFTVPVDPTINIIKKKLKQDAEVHNRISISIQNITTPLRFCPKTPTSFSRIVLLINARITHQITQMYPTFLWKTLKSQSSEYQPISQDYGGGTKWYLCCHEDRIQKPAPGAHQLCWHLYPVYYRGDQIRYIHALCRYPSYTRTR